MESEAASKPSGTSVQPKVFISYSWTTPGHQEQVRQWAERLMGDGIDVVLDVFDLKEGHDKYVFMEQMVTDPSITHVLMFCDKAYADKANSRRAGVGTESQIISREVYEKVAQSKFIPLVCELDQNGELFLPTFLKSRIWINFSSSEAANENWEKLVRALYGKPVYQKPQLGNAPNYITADIAAPTTPIMGKFSTFRHALLNDSKALKVYREDFLSICFDYADSLRVRQSPNPDSLAAKIIADYGKLKVVRNSIVDWILLESTTAASGEFCESLIMFLERLRALKSRPEELSSWNDEWFGAHSVFVYETFLYIIAALLKTSSYPALHEIFTTHYLRPNTELYGIDRFQDFGCFYGNSEIIQVALQPPAGRKFYSATAELMKRQADRTDLPFSSVIEAELLVFLMALIATDVRWYPQTLHYASQSELPFFLRATQHRNFLKLAEITGIDNADRLREVAKTGYERQNVGQWYNFAMMPHSFWNLLNIEKLDTLK